MLDWGGGKIILCIARRMSSNIFKYLTLSYVSKGKTMATTWVYTTSKNRYDGIDWKIFLSSSPKKKIDRVDRNGKRIFRPWTKKKRNSASKMISTSDQNESQRDEGTKRRGKRRQTEQFGDRRERERKRNTDDNRSCKWAKENHFGEKKTCWWRNN